MAFWPASGCEASVLAGLCCHQFEKDWVRKFSIDGASYCDFFVNSDLIASIWFQTLSNRLVITDSEAAEDE